MAVGVTVDVAGTTVRLVVALELLKAGLPPKEALRVYAPKAGGVQVKLKLPPSPVGTMLSIRIIPLVSIACKVTKPPKKTGMPVKSWTEPVIATEVPSGTVEGAVIVVLLGL